MNDTNMTKASGMPKPHIVTASRCSIAFLRQISTWRTDKNVLVVRRPLADCFPVTATVDCTGLAESSDSDPRELDFAAVGPPCEAPQENAIFWAIW